MIFYIILLISYNYSNGETITFDERLSKINNEIKYIGRCTDNFKKRINQGYGKIHPKNCFIDGQATNCHLNSLINSSVNVEFGIYIMSEKTKDEIKEMEKLILTCNRFEWNIQRS